eukprot:131948_1
MAEESRVSFNNRDNATNNYYDLRKVPPASTNQKEEAPSKDSKQKDVQNIRRFIERNMNEIMTPKIIDSLYVFVSDDQYDRLDKHRYNRCLFMESLVNVFSEIGFPDLRMIFNRFKYSKPTNTNNDKEDHEDIGELDVGSDDGACNDVFDVPKPKLRRDDKFKQRTRNKSKSHHNYEDKYRASHRRNRNGRYHSKHSSHRPSHKSHGHYKHSGPRKLHNRYDEMSAHKNRAKQRRNAFWNLNQSRTSPSREFKKHAKPLKHRRK